MSDAEEPSSRAHSTRSVLVPLRRPNSETDHSLATGISRVSITLPLSSETLRVRDRASRPPASRVPERPSPSFRK